MYLNFIRLFFLSMPLLYIWLIWLQSSRLNPSQLEVVAPNINYNLLLAVGILLELGHLILFGMLYLFIVLFFLTFGPLTRIKEYIALAISLSYSVLDEIHQYFIPFRSFGFDDIAKNMIGVLLLWVLVRRSYGKPNSKIGLVLHILARSSSKVSKKDRAL
ncbi:VanZ family protein [Alkalihalobacterium elongatum]|uniref:VanZ family protein n=1 Tax=Alkalihalobacterium elongatum TaxID=2675466 RepID=UPI001C1F7339|nr:VanZ family protein [Alkalihalobacterium elongatum]